MAITTKNSKGFIFLEIVISVAIIAVALVTFLGVAALALSTSTNIKQTAKIDADSKEEMEAIRSFRDGTTWGTNGLGSATTGTNYYLVLSGTPSAWALHAGSETVDGFTRAVVFDKVSRDPTTSNIEATYNAAHDDANTRKATVMLTWGSKTYTTVAYFTNWQP